MTPEPMGAAQGSRLLGAICLAYCVLVFYGSLMPYDLRASPSQVARHWDRAWTPHNPDGRLASGKADLASNILLYVPLGFLLATRFSFKSSGPLAVTQATVTGTLISAAVETVQLYSLSRTSSVLDLCSNTAGTLAGALAGAAWGMGVWRRAGRGVQSRWLNRPMELVALVLMAFLLADAAYPYLPTLEVSEVWGNIKSSQRSIHAGLSLHPWHHWMIDRVAIYAVLAVLLSHWGRGGDGRPRRLFGLAVAIVFAAAIEATKIFIQGGSAKAANVAMSACGATAGVALSAIFAGRLSAANRIALAWLLLLGYIVYLEWGFFDFDIQPDLMRQRVPTGAAWLPLYEYAMSGRAHDVHNFVRNIAVVAAWALAGRTWSQEKGVGNLLCPDGKQVHKRFLTPFLAAMWAGLLGLVLELGQFLTPDRIPSITDVLCFAAGGAIGAAIANLREKHLALNKQATESPDVERTGS